MKAYSIFDDFPQSSIDILNKSGIEVTLLPKGEERPQGEALRQLLQKYDILFISTAQKMPEDMFSGIESHKVIGTASSGTDHIHIPSSKQGFIKVANATHANRSTVTEHTFGLILSLRKHLAEARHVAAQGKTKKEMASKPVDLYGSTIGVVGAGGIASTVLRTAHNLGMKCVCWTLHPENHNDLKTEGVMFVDLDKLISEADVVSINIPQSEQTRNLIDARRVALFKDTAVVVSTSRAEIVDNKSLFERAKVCPSFCVGLDVDVQEVNGMWSEDMLNVIVTPHIAGGTVESRIRLFDECSENVVKAISEFDL